MKKKIVTIITIFLLFVIAIGYIVYINVNKANGNYNFSRIDIVFNERLFAKINKEFTYIDTSYILEDDYKENFKVNEVKVRYATKNDGSVTYINVVPEPDALGSYNILLENNTLYGVFTYTSQGKGEEIYRVYLKDKRVVGIRDNSNGNIITNKTYLSDKDILKIEKIFSYYIDIAKK